MTDTPAASRLLRLLSYNIRYGGIGRESHIAAVVNASGADLVVFQEATEPAVIERVAKATSMPVGAWRKGYSLAFITRLAIAKHEWYRPWWSRRHFLRIVPAEVTAQVFGVHLTAVHSNWTERRRARELRALLKSIRGYRLDQHVVVGDFNTLAPGEALDVDQLPPRLRAVVWLSGGTIRWQTVQLMLSAGYVDGFRYLNPLEKGHTFPTWSPHIRLDYAFVPAAHTRRLRSCDVLTGAPSARQGSDHFPLLVELEAA